MGRFSTLSIFHKIFFYEKDRHGAEEDFTGIKRDANVLVVKGVCKLIINLKYKITQIKIDLKPGSVMATLSVLKQTKPYGTHNMLTGDR